GRQTRIREKVSGAQRAGDVGEVRLLVIETEVIEVDVSPMSAVTVDKADEDLLALMFLQIDDDAVHVLALGPGGAEEDLAGIAADQLDAGGFGWPSANAEGAPGVGDLERRQGGRPLRVIAAALVAADPVIALVFALHVAAALDDGIALDRLSGEGVALGGPVAQVAGLEIEVQRLAVGPP